MSKEPVSDSITISQIGMNKLTFNVIGTSPFVPHAVSAKAKGSLLFPAPKKNAAEKASSMKHEPLEEYRDAAYKFVDEDKQKTRLYILGSMFHSAMSAVAIDMVGAKKAQIGRLTSVPQQKIPLYGIPKMWMTVVRSSDMARTPDIRTLPILPQWACTITIRFVDSLIKEASIANLLSAAGEIVGVGDGRPQKGKLSMGCFRLCSDTDPEFVALLKSQRDWVKAQDEALREPDYYDLETEELYTWFVAEKSKRAAAPAKSPKKGKRGEDTTANIAFTDRKKNGRERHA